MSHDELREVLAEKLAAECGERAPQIGVQEKTREGLRGLEVRETSTGRKFFQAYPSAEAGLALAGAWVNLICFRVHQEFAS
jgi:hypothetical protein